MFIVLEGLDGAGKSTQIALLREYFAGRGIESAYIHFPRFDAPVYGELIARFLRGEFGGADRVDPYLVALLFAGDRAEAAPQIRQWLAEGKVVLLDFWSAELGNSNALNAELKEIYDTYRNADTPFEVYQVAIDTSKPLWITAVQEQQLPWISVSDLRGRASTSLGLYNVRKLPANFLIDKEGTLVARDIYGKTLDAKLRQLTR